MPGVGWHRSQGVDGAARGHPDLHSNHTAAKIDCGICTEKASPL